MSEPSGPEKPRSRRWFVVLAWITLVLFAAFVIGITAGVAAIPMIRRARQAAGWEERR